MRRVEVDLDLAREYARAVYQHTDTALAELSPADLEREIDLTANGLGVQTNRLVPVGAGDRSPEQYGGRNFCA